MSSDLLKGHEVFMEASATCLMPSKYYVARRNGGKCNTTVYGKTTAEVEQKMYEHILEAHNG